MTAEVVDLLRVLRERGETVATAESLTAGMVCAELTGVSGASEVVRGGLVVYATDLKTRLAGVDEALLAERGPVDPAVAGALATGARERCGSDWGLGLTGVAGPSPQGGAPPGTVHFGFAGPRCVRVHSALLEGDRHEVRAAAVRTAVEQFARLLR